MRLRTTTTTIATYMILALAGATPMAMPSHLLAEDVAASASPAATSTAAYRPAPGPSVVHTGAEMAVPAATPAHPERRRSQRH